jgi:hypothetical protein
MEWVLGGATDVRLRSGAGSRRHVDREIASGGGGVEVGDWL